MGSGPRAAGGIEDSYALKLLIVSVQQIRLLDTADSVLRELADVEVIGDEIINNVNLACREPGTQLCIIGTAYQVFALCLGWQVCLTANGLVNVAVRCNA